MTTVPKTSPFAGIPLSDYVRDGAALVLLLVSFAMPWTSYAFATGRVEVILITLLSVFSLSITYLARAGVFPPSVTVNTVWMMRLLANAPYVVLVLVFLILDAATGANGAGGLGTAAAFGLSGALIAAQPREAETQTLGAGAPIAELWYRIVIGFGAIAVLSTLVGSILSLVNAARYAGFGTSGLYIALVLVLALVSLVAVVLLYGSLVRRSEVGRIVALAVGSAVLVAVLVDLFARFTISGQYSSLHSGGYLVLFLAVLAGLASAPSVRIAMTATDPVRRWLDAAAVTLIAMTALAGYAALNAIFTLIVAGPLYVGFGIGIIVCAVGMALIAVIARTMLVANPVANRPLVLMLMGLVVVLGIVLVVLQANVQGVDILSLLIAFGFPLSVVAFLAAPAAVRGFFASDSSAPLVPSAPPAQPTAAAVASRIAQALDPATPAATLYEFATADPTLRPYIAANPSTYPDLLNWLAELGDPAVDEALRAR